MARLRKKGFRRPTPAGAPAALNPVGTPPSALALQVPHKWHALALLMSVALSLTALQTFAPDIRVSDPELGMFALTLGLLWSLSLKLRVRWRERRETGS